MTSYGLQAIEDGRGSRQPVSTFLPVLNEVEKASIGERQPLPEAYLGLSDEEMALRIEAAKAALGDRLVILGHHYQRDEVIRFADYTGDSFKLANAIAKHPRLVAAPLRRRSQRR